MTGERLNLYTSVHKGFRMAHCRLLARLGSADWQDTDAVNALISDLKAHLAMSHDHVGHEDTYIHPRLAAVAPGVVEALERDHREVVASLGELHALMDAIGSAAPAERQELGYRLYMAFTRFMADDFRHMEREEAEANPALWQHMTDADLVDIHGALVGSIPPPRFVDWMRLYLPAIDPAERIKVLSGLRANAPEPVFLHILEMAAKPTLPAADWQKLAEGLGVSA